MLYGPGIVQPSLPDLEFPFYPVFGFLEGVELVDRFDGTLVHVYISAEQFLDELEFVVDPDGLFKVFYRHFTQFTNML